MNTEVYSKNNLLTLYAVTERDQQLNKMTLVDKILTNSEIINFMTRVPPKVTMQTHK